MLKKSKRELLIDIINKLDNLENKINKLEKRTEFVTLKDNYSQDLYNIMIYDKNLYCIRNDITNLFGKTPMFKMEEVSNE